MKPQIFVTNTLYHLYISLLSLYHLKQKEQNRKVYLVITDYNLEAEKYIQTLKKKGLFDGVFFVLDKKCGDEYKQQKYFIQRIFNRKRLINSIYQAEIDDALQGIMQQSDINLFTDASQFPMWMFNRFPKNIFRLYEDGERIYLTPKETISTRIKQYILRYPKKYGRDSQIKEVVVQRIYDLPKKIKRKGKHLDMAGLTQTLSDLQKEQLKRVFLPEGIKWDLDGNKLLLITQPISEDGYISEPYKIKLYQKVLGQYGKDYTVYIKPHPREKTDYTQYIDATIIPANFPLELMNYFEELEFEKGITIFSTALNNLDKIKDKVFLGLNWDATIQKAFPFKA